MDSNIVLTTVTSSAIFVMIIQWLKNASWFPLLQKEKKFALRIASIIFAFLGHAGASYVWNPAARQLVLTIPTFWSVLVYLWHVTNHYALQEITYQAVLNKTVVVTPGVQSSSASPTLIPKAGV